MADDVIGGKFFCCHLDKKGVSAYNAVCCKYGDIAQLGERLNGIQEVRGSNPLISTR